MRNPSNTLAALYSLIYLVFSFNWFTLALFRTRFTLRVSPPPIFLVRIPSFTFSYFPVIHCCLCSHFSISELFLNTHIILCMEWITLLVKHHQAREAASIGREWGFCGVRPFGIFACWLALPGLWRLAFCLCFTKCLVCCYVYCWCTNDFCIMYLWYGCSFHASISQLFDAVLLFFLKSSTNRPDPHGNGVVW